MEIKQLSSGHMPRTDFTYEALEAHLASYYLTYMHMQQSQKGNEVAGFDKLSDILGRIADRYGIQRPQEAIKNPRGMRDWEKPEKYKSYFMVKDSFRAFYSDYGIIDMPGDKEDIRELHALLSLPEFIV